MSAGTLPAAGSLSHVEAYCATGASPGRTGRVAVTFEATYGGKVTAHVGYEDHGPSYAAPIVVLGGISASRHLLPTSFEPECGWWPKVVAPAGALDPNRHRLIGIDYVGGPSSGLTLEHPISTFDQARALRGLLDHLGVDRVTLVGSSYGGMVALAFAALFPQCAHQLVVICAAHRSHPMATALRTIQRSAVRFARDVGRPEVGLVLARSLAMTTYRSAVEFDGRFDGAPRLVEGIARFPVESYLEQRGADFAGRFDADGFLALSESLDVHDVRPLEVLAPTTLVSFDTDTLVPPWLVNELAESAPGVTRHVELRTIFGHDGFLKEAELVSGVIRSALEDHDWEVAQ